MITLFCTESHTHCTYGTIEIDENDFKEWCGNQKINSNILKKYITERHLKLNYTGETDLDDLSVENMTDVIRIVEFNEHD